MTGAIEMRKARGDTGKERAEGDYRHPEERERRVKTLGSRATFPQRKEDNRRCVTVSVAIKRTQHGRSAQHPYPAGNCKLKLLLNYVLPHLEELSSRKQYKCWLGCWERTFFLIERSHNLFRFILFYAHQCLVGTYVCLLHVGHAALKLQKRESEPLELE